MQSAKELVTLLEEIQAKDAARENVKGDEEMNQPRKVIKGKANSRRWSKGDATNRLNDYVSLPYFVSSPKIMAPDC